MRDTLDIVCDRAYKGIYVDVRSYQAEQAISENKDIVITCKDFPYQRMTIKVEEIESKKAYEAAHRFKSNFDDSYYTLKTYKFIPDS